MLNTHKIEGISEFPIDFSVPLPDGVDTDKLRISAKVISGKGDETKEGDFVTETITPVNVWSSTITKVVGLESCDALHSGGFCSQSSKEKIIFLIFSRDLIIMKILYKVFFKSSREMKKLLSLEI